MNMVETSHLEMIRTITQRGRSHVANFDYASNNAMIGPNNLVRRKIDGVHCVGHALEPIDYIVGEFC